MTAYNDKINRKYLFLLFRGRLILGTILLGFIGYSFLSVSSDIILFIKEDGILLMVALVIFGYFWL